VQGAKAAGLSATGKHNGAWKAGPNEQPYGRLTGRPLR
jgi:hypothetical protein